MRVAALLLVCLLLACKHVKPAVPLPPIQDANAIPPRPERFKMVHQVAANYQGQSGVMQGYLLGRKDGSFRVSATAVVGPRLFDAVKRAGTIETRVHLKQISERMDVRHIVEAIDRIYFLDCPVGPAEDDAFVSRCPVKSGDDVDELEETVSARYLTPVLKRYFFKGALRSTVTFQEFQEYGERWVAKKVKLQGTDGYTIEISLENYVPEFAFDDALLKL
ncbi:MAG: hypothetical protein ACT4TC_10730 [Myxococcaceae bacterium]